MVNKQRRRIRIGNGRCRQAKRLRRGMTDLSGSRPGSPTDGTALKAVRVAGGVVASSSPTDARAFSDGPFVSGAAVTSTPVRQTVAVDARARMEEGQDWPPRVNALGMIGQYEIAQELDNQARKAKGWGERFSRQVVRRACRRRQDDAGPANCRTIAATGSDHIQWRRSSPTGNDRRSPRRGRESA